MIIRGDSAEGFGIEAFVASLLPLGNARLTEPLWDKDKSERERSRTMPESKSLHDMFIDELRDAYDAEKQLTKALPKLARAANSEQLRAAFEEHLTETQGHV